MRIFINSVLELEFGETLLGDKLTEKDIPITIIYEEKIHLQKSILIFYES